MITPGIVITPSPQAQQLIANLDASATKLIPALTRGLDEALTKVENHIKRSLFAGGAQHGGGVPVGVRTGALRQAISHMVSGLDGYVGVLRGTTTRYAGVILGTGPTTIKPKDAGHLWVPVADNLDASGNMRLSPRAAMELKGPSGKRLLRIFYSKKGNLVAFMPESRKASSLADRSAVGVATGRRYKRGNRKGQLRGKLLFVLKDEVTVQGSGALARGVAEQREVITAILNRTLEELLTDG